MNGNTDEDTLTPWLLSEATANDTNKWWYQWNWSTSLPAGEDGNIQGVGRKFYWDIVYAILGHRYDQNHPKRVISSE